MVKAKIHNIFKTLTPTEQKIAQYILENSSSVVNMTVSELAAKCGTVPSAVNRMCKSMGVDGFSKLKILLAGDIKTDNTPEYARSFDKTDTASAVFAKVFSSGVGTLKNTLAMLDSDTCQTFVQKLADAERIFLFGVGTSAVVAMDASYRFSQLGLQAYAYTDILQMSVMAKNMKKGDVAFVISHSGATKPVVEAMRFANEAGACTLGLTSFSKSLVYKECNHAICVYADEENYPVEAVSARIAHMCIVDALMMAIALKDYHNYSKHISMRNDVLSEIRY